MQDILKQQHQMAHDNVKQIFTSFVGWFTFFWTLNAGALGWLYSPQAMQLVSPAFNKGRLYLSVIFTILNILGVGVCWTCWRAMVRLQKEAVSAVRAWMAIAPNGTCNPAHGLFPNSLTRYVYFAGAFSLLLNIVAWVLLPNIAVTPNGN